jgi:hypothetical protein
MILYLKDPTNSTKKLLDLIKTFSKVYKVNIQKSVPLLCTNNEPIEKEITNASKILKYLGTNLMK